ncbi:MAG: hypothetical protein PVG53_14875 [Holophagae bacterium]|jgi:hypothetical protein
MRRLGIVLLTFLAGATAWGAPGKGKTDITMLAASVGDQVVLADPSTGRTASFDTGPVGWLYPAPGGVLFAPDVVNNRTTVIDMRSLAVTDTIDGLTMPHFGESPDRYVALADDIVVMSYPERAVMARITSDVTDPWQVIMLPEDAAMLILERRPDGSTDSRLAIVNLVTRRVAARRTLDSDYVHVASSARLGLIALADAEHDRVRLMQPAAMVPVADHPTTGHPRDVAFVLDGMTLATALDTGSGGALELATFKSGKKGLRLGKQHAVALPSAPVRLASAPDGVRIAVAMSSGAVAIVDADQREIVRTLELPGQARDLCWCDLTRDGPIEPEWSDGETAMPEIETPTPPKVDDETGALRTPGGR